MATTTLPGMRVETARPTATAVDDTLFVVLLVVAVVMCALVPLALL